MQFGVCFSSAAWWLEITLALQACFIKPSKTQLFVLTPDCVQVLLSESITGCVCAYIQRDWLFIKLKWKKEQRGLGEKENRIWEEEYYYVLCATEWKMSQEQHYKDLFHLNEKVLEMNAAF